MNSFAQTGIDEKLLLLPATAQAGAATGNELAQHGIASVVCGDAAELCREIECRSGGVALIEARLTAEDEGRLLMSLQEPCCRSSTTLILLVSAEDTPGDALAGADDVILLDQPVRIRTLVGTVRAALRHRNQHVALRRALAETERHADESLARLAHELLNPLAPISNSLSILRLTQPLVGDAEQTVQIMERQVALLVRLVEDLLELSRLNRGSVELRTSNIDLATVLHTAAAACRPQIDAGRHRLILEPPPEPLTLCADAVRLTQALIQLLGNAAKYSEQPGEIRVRASRSGGDAVISVHDAGAGISAELQARIFEPFFQGGDAAGRRTGGLGIGLTLAKRYAELHGGCIEVRSDGPGRGSEFRIRLPLALPTTHPTETSSPSQMTREISPHRILVVEDTRAVAFMLARLLEAIGQTVHVCHDAESALAHLRSDVPDVVLTDIAMPNIDGYELARRLRAEPRWKDVKLVALSGYGQASDRRRAKEVGFDHYLVKPVSLAALKELLSALPA